MDHKRLVLALLPLACRSPLDAELPSLGATETSDQGAESSTGTEPSDPSTPSSSSAAASDGSSTTTGPDGSTTLIDFTESGSGDGDGSSSSTGSGSTGELDACERMDICLEPTTSFDVPGFVYSFTVADLDGDGNLDVIASANGSDAIQVFLGDGAGDFTAQPRIDFDDGVSTTKVGDFDGDDILDAFVVRLGVPGQVHLLIGSGDGTFTDVGQYVVGNSPAAGGVGDFNGDGNLDGVTVHYADHAIELLLGDGAGGLQVDDEIPTIIAPWRSVAGRFDGDGIDDLVIAGAQTLRTFLGSTDGSYGEVDLEYGTLQMGLTAADFDADGVLDIACGDAGMAEQIVSVHLGVGDGSFLAPTELTPEGSAGHLAVGDINDDGILDLVGTPWDDTVDLLHVMVGVGDGTFEDPISLDMDDHLGPPAVGDFDNDGVDDILVVTDVDGTAEATVLLSRP